MTEFLDTVQFTVRGPDDWRLLASLETASHGQLAARGSGTISLLLEGRHVEVPVDLRRTDGRLSLRAILESVDYDLSSRLEVLGSSRPAEDWLLEFSRLPPGWLSLTLHVEFAKPNDPDMWIYCAFSPEGESSLLEELRGRFARGEVPELLVIRTLDASRNVSCPGLQISPLGTSLAPGSRGSLIIPEEPTGWEAFLAQLQLEYVFLALLKKPAAPRAECSPKAASRIGAWLSKHDLRKVLASEYIETAPTAIDDESAGELLARLEAVELELVGGAVARFKQAAEAFREVSTLQLRDMARMRSEAAALMGAELFRIATSIGVTLAGLSFAKLTETATLSLAAVVGLVFFVGAAGRAITQEREFRNYVQFNALFARLPTASAMPQFRTWFTTSLESAIRSFYVTYVAGLFLASAPLVAIAAYVAFRAVSGAGLVEGVSLTILSLLGYAVVLLIWRPWRIARILTNIP